MSDPRVGYWLHDEEDQEFLNSLPNESPVLAMRGTYDEIAFDPRKVMKVEMLMDAGANFLSNAIGAFSKLLLQ